MISINKDRLEDGQNHPINDRFSISQIKIQDIINDTEILQYRKDIETKFLFSPKDAFVELYDMKIFYWEVDRYDFFVHNCHGFYGSELENFNKFMKYLLVDRNTGDAIDFHFKFIKKDDRFFIYDDINNILLDEELYNNIREIIKVLNFKESYDIDDSGIHGKTTLKIAVDIAKDERKHTMHLNSDNKGGKTELGKMISLVQMVRSGVNVRDMTLYQLVDGYIEAKKFLEFLSVKIGLYSQVDFSKNNKLREIEDLI